MPKASVQFVEVVVPLPMQTIDTEWVEVAGCMLTVRKVSKMEVRWRTTMRNLDESGQSCPFGGRLQITIQTEGLEQGREIQLFYGRGRDEPISTVHPQDLVNCAPCGHRDFWDSPDLKHGILHHEDNCHFLARPGRHTFRMKMAAREGTRLFMDADGASRMIARAEAAYGEQT